ncbi:MAG: hypothetical protein ACHQ49_18230 [Elusimicrobiota bacterium]
MPVESRRERIAIRPAAAALLVSCLCARAAALPPDEVAPSSASPSFSFSADYFESSESSRTAVFQGHARVRDEDAVVGSDSLTFDMDSLVLRSTGPLTIQQEDGMIAASSGSIRTDTGDGTIWGARVSQAPWFFNSASLTISNGRDYLPRADFTTCEKSPPDYHVSTSRLVFYPDHWIQSWNNVVYLGRWPLFYWPYWYHSVAPGGSSYKTNVDVTQDKRNGWAVRTDTDLRVTPYVYDHLLADLYQNEGLGVGSELDYNKSNEYRGTLYVYDIKERQTGLNRWTVTADHWQHLGGLYSTQWRLQDMSDPAFNGDYYRSNDTPTSPTLTNSAALVRQSTMTTTRLSYSRLDGSDPNNPNGFIKTSEDVPRLDFNTTSFKVAHLPGLQQFTAFADRNYALGRSFDENSAGATWNATGVMPLKRWLTFTPMVGLSETYLQQDSGISYGGAAPLRDNITLARYLETADIRYRSKVGMWDLKHGYTGRLAANELSPDTRADDHGVEQNLVSLGDLYTPFKRTTLQIGSGYDLRQTARNAAAPLEFKDRLQPLTANFQVGVGPKVNLSLNEAYKVDEGKQSQQSIIVQGNYGNPGENNAGLGFSKNASNPQQTQLNQSLGLFPRFWSWNFEASTHWQVGGGPSKLLTANLQLRKSWHDFSGQVGAISSLHGVVEWQGDFRMKFREAPSQGITRPADEEEWYPWRDGLNPH